MILFEWSVFQVIRRWFIIRMIGWGKSFANDFKTVKKTFHLHSICLCSTFENYSIKNSSARPTHSQFLRSRIQIRAYEYINGNLATRTNPHSKIRNSSSSDGAIRTKRMYLFHFLRIRLLSWITKKTFKAIVGNYGTCISEKHSVSIACLSTGSKYLKAQNPIKKRLKQEANTDSLFSEEYFLDWVTSWVWCPYFKRNKKVENSS